MPQVKNPSILPWLQALGMRKIRTMLDGFKQQCKGIPGRLWASLLRIAERLYQDSFMAGANGRQTSASQLLGTGSSSMVEFENCHIGCRT